MNSVEEQWITGPRLARHFNVTPMSIWRWLRDPNLAFPRPTQIRKRNFWRVADIREFEKRMVAAGLRDTRGEAA
jgi:hypothetical protein